MADQATPKTQVEPSREPRSKQIVHVPEASIGQMGKLITDLALILEDSTISLVKNDDHSKAIVDPFQWKDITGLNLQYKPLSLHQLILEVNTTRIRETTGKKFVDHFVVLHFHTKDIATIEAEIEKRNLKALVKEGISQVMVYPPFSYSYNVPLRKTINFLGKVTKAFTTLCLIYTILVWLTTCPKGSPETCTTYLGAIFNFFKAIVTFVPNLAYPYVVSVYDFLNTIPILKYFVFALGTLVLLPFWSLFALIAVIVYMSEFALQIHLFLHIMNMLSVVVTNYKAFNTIFKYVIGTITFVWKKGHQFYLAHIKSRLYPTPPVIVPPKKKED